MKNESLEQAWKVVMKAIIESKIEKEDKVELMLNLHHFLQPSEYKESIKILIKERGKK